MRKWMRDRLKRPKKSEEAGKGQAAQAPLQPAYYDADVSAPASPTALSEPRIMEAEIEPQPVMEPAAMEDSADAKPTQAARPAAVPQRDPRLRGPAGRASGVREAAGARRDSPARALAEVEHFHGAGPALWQFRCSDRRQKGAIEFCAIRHPPLT